MLADAPTAEARANRTRAICAAVAGWCRIEETGEMLGITLGMFGSLRLLGELRAPAASPV
jgi:hypothetical protein